MRFLNMTYFGKSMTVYIHVIDRFNVS